LRIGLPRQCCTAAIFIVISWAGAHRKRLQVTVLLILRRSPLTGFGAKKALGPDKAIG